MQISDAQGSISGARVKEKVPPVVVLEGEEKFLKEEEISALRASIEAQFGSAEFLELDGNSATPALVLDEVRTYPLFGGGKLAILRNAQTLLEEGGELFKNYLGSPSKFSCLVLDLEKLDRRTSFGKAASGAGIVKTCAPVPEREVAAWLIAHAQRVHGKKLRAEDARLIVEFVGCDLSLLANEMEKLASVSADSPAIEREKIESIVVRGRARDLFALSNAIERKDAKSALSLLIEIMTQGALQRDLSVEHDPARIQEQVINVLRWSMNRLIRANLLLSRGVAEDEVAQKLRISPYFADAFFASLERFPEAECLRCHSEIVSADLSLKSEDREAESVLTALVLSLCR
jgi:DNA polymerase III delta subunit